MTEVSCAIIKFNKKILTTQRSLKMSLPLKWEFPGGKIEEGETAEECIIREIKEELCISIKIVETLSPITHQYSKDKIIKLIPFICLYISGEIKLTEHEDFCWLDKSELANLDWAEADVPILNEFLNKKYERRNI